MGLVIPTFGRPHYVQRCLASLAESRLESCLICLVDETRAPQATREVEGFEIFPNVDSPGGNLESVDGGFEEVLRSVERRSQCVAFDSLGSLKSRVSWMTRNSPGRQLFIRSDYLRRRPWLRGRLSRLAGGGPDPRTEELVRAFAPAGLPLIKLFKRQHANMHDSLLRGWQLLTEIASCRFLCVLDSDTVVQPDWLPRMLDLHNQFSHLSPLLVSGFHTRAHPALEVGHDFCRKGSVGGVSLLFDQQVWGRLVKPNLRSSQWDRVVSEEVIKEGGSIVATRPSAVEHIGRRGVWSHGWTFDRAEDFRHSP